MIDTMPALSPSLRREKQATADLPGSLVDSAGRNDVNRYVAAQEKADKYRNIAGYLNWVTTGLIGLTLLLTGGIIGVVPFEFVLPFGLKAGVAAALAGAASVVSLMTNIGVSKAATNIAEQANVLYSDIDSKNQAKRMVEAFAKTKAVADSPSDLPFARRDGKSWTQSVGERGARSGSWVEKVSEAEGSNSIGR